MAKSQLSYTKNTVSKITVKGILSEDGDFITYLDADKEEQEISVADCLKDFKGEEISFTVSLTQNEDLEIDPSDEQAVIPIINLERLSSESEEKYLWRIGQAKDCGKLDMDWNQVAAIMNREFRESESEYRTEAAYRKRYSEAKKFFDAGVFRNDSDEKYSKQLMEQKRELELAKIAYRDERNAWQKQNYVAARVEQRLDYLEEQLKSCGKVNFECVNSTHDVMNNMSKTLIVPIADLHIGQCFVSKFGEYNSDIAKKELELYLQEVIKIGKLHNANTIHCCCLGDEISGSIHKSLAITNRENVIEQVKLASQLIASFCHSLCQNFNTVYFTSVNGNHSRIDRKDDALKDERLDDMVAWSVCNILNHVDNFIVDETSLDSTIKVVNIYGKSYVMIHGDMDDINKNGVGKLVMMLGFVPDYVVTAHKHTCAFTSAGVEVYQTGSFVPSGDDYTIQKRLSGKASQTVLVCDEHGVKCSYNIKLS